MQYISRWLEVRLVSALESHPVTVLTGPRQVGKSTLLKHAKFLENWRYITLDDPDSLEQAREDPKGLLWEDKPTIIDEIQRCPELLLAVKYLVDQSDRKRMFILSGSGNISLRKAPRETLAGRAQYLHLTGFSHREIRGCLPYGPLDEIWNDHDLHDVAARPSGDLGEFVWRGSLPGVVLAPSERVALERLGSYVDTYIRRDVQDLVRVRHPQNFRRLMESLAQATGWESVQEELSKHCGETRTNVSRYLSLLKETNLLYEIRGYAVKGERAYRRSKYFWFDSGTACFLSGIHRAEDLKESHIKGRFLENYVLQQILSWASVQIVPPEIYYWKPKAEGVEVDFVVRRANKVVGLEVKSSKDIAFRDTRSMREFLKAHPEVSKGIIVYGGDKTYPVASNIYAVPWTVF